MIGRAWSTLVAPVLFAAAVALGGCGGDNDAGDAGGAASKDISGRVSIIAVWSGDEQRSFEAVLEGFTEQHPNVTVKYTSGGDNVPTILATAVQGGRPPDIAGVAQPGLVRDLQKKGALQPIEFARSTIADNFPEDIVRLGEIDGRLYSLLFKAANKSTVWYNVGAFEDAGVEPPETWDELLETAETLKAAGIPAYSIAGADGWTLTDLFENIYLRQAGPERYDQLTAHEIPWTDESVKEALATMADVIGDKANIAGGASGALQTDFPTSVANVFTASPKAAMVIEGDFVPGAAANTELEPGTGYDVFPFPKLGDVENAVVGGGDAMVMFRRTPASEALMEYLASPEAAEIWAERGGFSTANRNVPDSAYPDDITRRTATAIADADVFRFDMSDQQPAEFGGTPGQGEWKILQDFLANPSAVDGTAEKLEAAAAKAHG
jgi:ABC-type glycerol-3-phosphate transport system substrate-binding protein